MEFFVDIADIEKVEKVAEYFPIDGFTTNPNILITHPSTDVSLSMFRHSWKDHFGDTEITDGLN